MSLKQQTAPPDASKPGDRSPATTAMRRTLQVLLLALLVIPIVVVWQLLNNRLNSTDPTIAGQPLSNPKTHLHTLALGGKTGVIYLGTHFGLFTSSDGGRTWPQQRGFLNSMMILNIAVSPTNLQNLAVIARPSSGLGNQGGIYFSSDGGNTLHPGSDPSGLSPSAYLFTIQAGSADEGNFYAFYEYAGWFETRDMGAHWYPITSGTLSDMQTPSLLGDPTHPNHLLLGGDQGLYQSQDDGRHWQQVPAVSGNVLNLVASSTSPRLIFCSTDQGLYRWREGNTQITHIANLPMANAPTRLVVNAIGTVLYALAGPDLWYSNDSGTTWKHHWQFDRGDLVSLVVDPQNPQHLYAGFFLPPKVITSTNEGYSWQSLAG